MSSVKDLKLSDLKKIAVDDVYVGVSGVDVVGVNGVSSGWERYGESSIEFKQLMDELCKVDPYYDYDFLQ